ncbi:host attachment protein [Fontimonas sp. SYSU GA230001]|uniref:host attachment protein n=1 Tax=Fontimonas sp. SYSU GA230001 TaxID=3142450 RepID=UPI0032B5B9B4
MRTPQQNAQAVAAVWVLVADRSQARLLQALPGGLSVQQAESFEHPEGRLRNHELVSDAPGTSIGPGYRQSAPTQKGEPTEHEARKFAQRLGRRLSELRAAHPVTKIFLVAEPHFLGMLRAELDEPTRRCIAGEVHRRLINEANDAILAALPQPLT